MNFIYRNIAVLHVLAVFAAFSWVFGGTRSELLVPVIPWVYALLLEGMLFFPQRRSTEDITEARERVWWHLAHDPLTYVSLAIIVILAFPFANRGLCAVCDYAAIIAGADPRPPIPYAPFCVSPREHLAVFLWFAPALTAMLAARHALLKRGKRLLLELMVWNGVALAVLGFVQQATGAVGPFWIHVKDPVYFFSAWGYPNMAGDFFTVMFALSVGLWQMRVQEIAALPPPHEFDSFKQPKHKFLRAHYLLAAVVLNFFAALDTLSRAAILLVILLAVVMFFHVFIGYFTKASRLVRVKMSVASVFGVLALVLAVFVFAPADLGKEMATITPDAVMARVSGKGQYHTRVAMAIFEDYPLFGVGGWGYKHFCICGYGYHYAKPGDPPRNYMTDDELKQMQVVGGINVHNDYLQLLCEHGAVVAALLLAVFLLLVCPIFAAWRRLYKFALFAPPELAPAKPYSLYSLPSPVFGILLGCSATIVHSFGDCPLRSPAVLTLFLVSLACADGFLPRERA